jgi:hypothetical protein
MNTFILYARISSNSSDQIQSLDNQLEILNMYRERNIDIENTVHILSDVISTSNGMSSELKKYIINNFKSTIVVTSIDRITRYISDITLIKKYVGLIISLNDDKIYNVVTDWKLILNKIIIATDEIDTLKLRTKNNNKKRKMTTDNTENLLSMSRIRVSRINTIMSKYVDNNILENINNLINMSQMITSDNIWKTITYISKKYNGLNIMSCYNSEKLHDTYLTRKDVYEFVDYIFKQNNIYINPHLFKEYINANIWLARKQNKIDCEYYYDDNNDDNNDDDDDNITTYFEKIIFNKKNINKLDKSDIDNITQILGKITKNKVNSTQPTNKLTYKRISPLKKSKMHEKELECDSDLDLDLDSDSDSE